MSRPRRAPTIGVIAALAISGPLVTMLFAVVEPPSSGERHEKPLELLLARCRARCPWCKPLATTMHDNVSNYAQIDSLPNFNLFEVALCCPRDIVGPSRGFRAGEVVPHGAIPPRLHGPGNPSSRPPAA